MNTVVATVPVGSSPRGVAVDPSTNRIYVTNSGDGTVSVIEEPSIPMPTSTFTPVPPTPTFTPTPTLWATPTLGPTPTHTPNTPPGSNVAVDLNGGLHSIGGIQTTFSSVTGTGYTSVDLGSSGPPPPTGYQLIGVAGQPAY